MKQTTHDIGRIGENIVLNLLEGSTRITGEPYDILWDDIRIDVKTTKNISKGGQVNFNVPGNDKRHNGILLVYVYIGEAEPIMFVDRYRVGKQTAFYLDEAIPINNIKNILIEWNSRSVDPITIDDINGKKSIQISDELHEKIIKLHGPYKKHIDKMVPGITVTIPLIIGVAVQDLELKLERENAHNQNG